MTDPITLIFVTLGAARHPEYEYVGRDHSGGFLGLADDLITVAALADQTFDELNTADPDGWTGCFADDVAQPLGAWWVDCVHHDHLLNADSDDAIRDFVKQRLLENWINPREKTDLIATAPELYNDLRAAVAQLRKYEALHRAKNTADSTAKADVNAQLACQFERTLAKARGETGDTS